MNTKTNYNNGKTPAILQVLPEMRSGGVVRGTIEMASAISKRGFRSYVSSAGGGMDKKLAYVGTEHIKLPLASKNPFRIYGNIDRICKLIKDLNISLLHARSRAPAWSAYYAAKKCNIPFVTTFHGIYGLQNEWKRKYNSIMTYGEKVIAISEFNARHIIDNYDIDADKIEIIYRGVDLDVFDPTRVNRQRVIQLAKSWRLPEDVPIIMLPGRITRWKGQHHLIDAIKNLPHRNFFCVLVGDHEGHPKYRMELEEQVLNLGLGDKIRIVGDTSDMPAAYMLAHVVVAPSIEPEAFGRVAIEAQAMGRPVIAYAHGGATETIIKNKTGWLVEPNSIAGLTKSLHEALALSESRIEEIAYDAVEHARRNFSSQVMCAKEIALYEKILASRNYSV